jgi:hypothetical protein
MFSPACPSTVGFVRSGDRPADNAAATDQPAATKITGDSEDIGAAGSAATDHATAGEAGAGEPGQPPDLDNSDKSDKPAAGDPPLSGENGDGPREDGGPAKPSRRTRPALRRGASRVGAARIGARTGLFGWSQRGRFGRRRERPDRQPRYPDLGGAGFARLTVLPAILIAAWLLVGLPLLLAGVFLPTPVLLGAVVLAVLLIAGLHRVPARWPGALSGAVQATRAAGAKPARERGWPAWWGLVGTVAVAAGFAFWQFLFNSESVIVLRDPGAYLQTGYWLAQHGSLPIPQSLAAFGGAHPGLTFSSIGFAAHGTSVVPGLMSGLPLLLAGAFWVHGTAAAAAMGPILGGLAVLAFGGLVGRLTGPQWAPAGALVLACTLPEQYTSRASFSETAAQVLLFGGLSLVIDALTTARARTVAVPSAGAQQPAAPPPPDASAAAPAPAAPPPPTPGPAASSPPVPGPAASSPPAPGGGWRRRLVALSPGRDRAPEWALMALGGLALGLTSLVRFDGLLDVLPAIPFVGVLVARRNKNAVPFSIGLAIGAAYGIGDAYLLARPFVDSLLPMPELIGLIAAWLLAMTVAGVELMRLPGFRRGLRPVLARRPVRWLPDFCGLLAVAAIVGLAIRPYLQTVRGPATGPAANFVASLQRLEHLPVAPGRLYAEDTLYWVIWYVGLPAVLLGGFGLALLVRRSLRALFSMHDPPPASPSLFTARVWALPLAVICSGSAAVLWQPETVPDQPWASRRLVPLVIPGLILCAVWAAAWLRGRAQSRGASKTAASVVAAFCIAALLVPTVATSFGFTTNHSGKGGALGITADGLALKRTGPGEVGAVNRLCSLLGPSASVVIVALPVAQQFTQVIRGMCGIPTASMVGQPAGSVQSVLASIEHAGRRPVLLGARPSQLYAYGGGSPVRVLNLSTSQDPHTLTQPPTTLFPADYVIWMSSVGPVGARV